MATATRRRLLHASLGVLVHAAVWCGVARYFERPWELLLPWIVVVSVWLGAESLAARRRGRSRPR